MAAITRCGAPKEVLPLGEAMDRLFREAFAWPRVFEEVYPMRRGFGFMSNLYEAKDGFIVQVALPGVIVESLEITAREAVLTVRGKTEVAVPEKAQALWVGLTGGEFREEITLPAEVAAEHAEAMYQQGVLTLVLPKAEHTKVKTIKVEVAQPQVIEGLKK